MNDLPAHSPVGASGAYRWMACPGSVQLSQGVADPESDFAAEGTAAHYYAAECLKNGYNAWEYIGRWTTSLNGGEPFDKTMADAVQMYLDEMRGRYFNHGYIEGKHWIEHGFHCPEIHEFFYGCSDFVHYDDYNNVLHVWDYKHGAGIVVDVIDNPQLKYYAIGVLESMDLWTEVDRVVLGIAQPRGFHSDGPMRTWAITPGDLETWLDDELLPAMDTALISSETASGEHCRFCPARFRACPQIMKDMTELEEFMNTKLSDKEQAPKLSNVDCGRFLDLLDKAKIVGKAANQTAFNRLQAGKGDGLRRKLVKGKANRIFKGTAEAAAKKEFGKKAFTEPALKSPAQMEKMPKGDKFVEEYAFKPEASLVVVPENSSRREVSRNTKSLFKPQ